MDERRARLLCACGYNEGLKQGGKEEAATGESSAAAAAQHSSRDRKASNLLSDDQHLDIPFWKKVRDTLLSDAEKSLLTANPAMDTKAVRVARVELALAQLDSMFHLDPQQVEALRPLAERVAEQDVAAGRVTSLDILQSFG